jgi:hypothetical protein
MGPFSEGWTDADVEAVVARSNPDELLYVPIVVGINIPNPVLSLAAFSRWTLRNKAAQLPATSTLGLSIMNVATARRCWFSSIESVAVRESVSLYCQIRLFVSRGVL